MGISLSTDSAVLFFCLFSVAVAVLPSDFVPPFNDSEQLLKGLIGAGQSLVSGAITLASNGDSFPGRYRHGKPAKPVNTALSVLHRFQELPYFRVFLGAFLHL